MRIKIPVEIFSLTIFPKHSNIYKNENQDDISYTLLKTLWYEFLYHSANNV
jgi:hypothetical protein